MTIKRQLISLYTLVRREVGRMFRISSQVFLPPVITTTLYFLIFGSIIGQRIGTIEGVNYNVFIAPGLIMMTVITNTYGNVSTSLFSLRFQKSIEEILVSPISNSLLLLGFIIGGVVRGLLVAFLVYVVAAFFLPVTFNHLPLTLLVVLMVSVLFSLAGFTNAMLARNFDEVMLIPTFVLTPLTYLGGVFYSINMLPPLWKTISYFNPIMYMVSALRHAMVGTGTISLALSLSIMTGLILALLGLNMWMLERGIGLRD